MKEVKTKTELTFEEKIVQLRKGVEKLAGLYDPSAKASEKPDSGITIQNKSAFFVIRDCATLAHDFLPIVLYSSTTTPLVFYKNQFTRLQIIDFVERCYKKISTMLLLKIIILDITAQPRPIEVKTPIVDNTGESDDVYGDYGNEEIKHETNHPTVDINVKDTIITTLIEAFAKE